MAILALGRNFDEEEQKLSSFHSASFPIKIAHVGWLQHRPPSVLSSQTWRDCVKVLDKRRVLMVSIMNHKLAVKTIGAPIKTHPDRPTIMAAFLLYPEPNGASSRFWLHTLRTNFDNQRRDGQLSVRMLQNPKYETLSNIIGAFKTTAATCVNKLRGVIGQAVWQRSFYERVIRNEQELNRIYEYIRNNPIEWVEGRDNPVSPRFKAIAKSSDDY